MYLYLHVVDQQLMKFQLEKRELCSSVIFFHSRSFLSIDSTPSVCVSLSLSRAVDNMYHEKSGPKIASEYGHRSEEQICIRNIVWIEGSSSQAVYCFPCLRLRLFMCYICFYQHHFNRISFSQH